MGARRIATLGPALLLLVVGCQGVVSEDSTETNRPSPSSGAKSTRPSPGASAEPGPLAAAETSDPTWITRPALTCGEPDRLFPPEALQGPGLAELGPDPAAAVLRAVIAGYPPETRFPESGWHRVVDRPDGVTFMARGDAATPWWAVTVGDLAGTLQATGEGQCWLAIAPPNGVTLAQWWLDPDGAVVTPETTKLAVLLRERACASGKPPEGRVMEPTIVMATESIVIAIGIQKQLTGQDCPGNPAFAFEVVLPEAIGARELFDASEFPPRPITSTDPR